MINIDSYSTNGNVNKTCQDYSLYGDNPFPYAIICDGCSSSRFTDVGARLLAHTAKNVLFEIITDDRIIEYNLIKITICNRISSLLKLLEIPIECMDATLIISFIKNDYINTIMFGDGQLFTYFNNEHFNLKTIEYKNNMPYYLSYEMVENKKRKESYKELYKNDNLTKEIKIEDKDYLQIVKYKYNKVTYCKTNIKNVKFYLIMSDGTESFINRITGERVKHNEIVDMFSSFKNYNGEFIKRRVKKAIEILAKESIYNTDDISVAGFNFIKKSDK